MNAQKFTPSDLNEGFVVAIQIDAKPGEEDRLANSLEALVEPTMAEPGVKLFLPNRSPTDPKAFFVFELYESEGGWAAHQDTTCSPSATMRLIEVFHERRIFGSS